MMSHEQFQDMGEVFLGWRCVICGLILDPVILQNRLVSEQLRAASRAQHEVYEEAYNELFDLELEEEEVGSFG